MNHPKNIPRIFSNQLICYAAARRVAQVNNAELVLVAVSGVVRDHDYQRRYQLDHYNIPHSMAAPAGRLERFSPIRRAFTGLLPD
jgi:hypothetical protein